MTDQLYNLPALLDELILAGRSPRSNWTIADDELALLGLDTMGDWVVLPAELELLRPEALIDGMSSGARQWLSELRVHRAIGSTNTELRTLADQRSIHGMLSIAELQVQGRGRHGRQWHSPFAGNIALSLGIALDLPITQLGGLSLAVGLAITDVLNSARVAGVQLKWPNDVLLHGAKLGGILIELVQKNGAVELVVGVGLNLKLPEQVSADIGQPAAALEDGGRPLLHRLSRNRLAAQIVSAILDYLEQYRRVGFGPMRELFDANHHYHLQHCELVRGADRIWGRVQGVTEGGELLLETDDGIRAFSAGEVSLRRR